MESGGRTSGHERLEVSTVVFRIVMKSPTLESWSLSDVLRKECQVLSACTLLVVQNQLNLSRCQSKGHSERSISFHRCSSFHRRPSNRVLANSLKPTTHQSQNPLCPQLHGASVHLLLEYSNAASRVVTSGFRTCPTSCKHLASSKTHIVD